VKVIVATVTMAFFDESNVSESGIKDILIRAAGGADAEVIRINTIASTVNIPDIDWDNADGDTSFDRWCDIALGLPEFN